MATVDKSPISLLEYLANQLNAEYLSDISLKRYRALLPVVLLNVNELDYEIKQWNEAIHYILSKKTTFTDVREAKEYLITKLKNAKMT